MPSALSIGASVRWLRLRAGVALGRFQIGPADAVRPHEGFARESRVRAKRMGGNQRSHAMAVHADRFRQTYEA